MERAAERFGGNDGLFNAACFSEAFMKLAGCNGALDGRIVRAILCGRRDVDAMVPGDAHYKIRAEPSCDPS